MSRIKGLAARLRSLLRPRSAERRMEEEFAFHVEMESERLHAQGISFAESRRRALATFGGVERYREEMREGRPVHWIRDIGRDLRYAGRMLHKQRGLTLLAIGSLALGIGANSAIFSVVNAVLLRPRPVARPDELVQLYAGHREIPYQTLSYPSYLEFRKRNDVFTGLAAYGIGYQFKLSGQDDVELVWGEPVSANYFEVLGVPAYRGRMFAPDEDRISAPAPVVVIGHGLWQRRFGSDVTVIGKTIRINNQPLTVIGVAPPRYTGMTSGWVSDLWVPATLMPHLEPSSGEGLLTRDSKWVTLVGRLQPGKTIEHARRRFELLTKAMQLEHPEEWLERREEWGGQTRENFVSVLTERQTRPHPSLVGPAYGVAALLFVVVNLVLVIACMNLAGMLFARGVARRNEIAVRLALGARRSRLVRQLLAESVLLSLIAGTVGIALAFWGLRALTTFMPALPEGIRLSLDVQLDFRVVLYTIGFAVLTGLLFGLAPALHSSRSTVSAVLKDDVFAFAGRTGASRARRALIVAQIAFSLLLLIGAGFTLRSLEKVRPTRLGFGSENVLVAPLALDEASYDRQKAQRFYRQLSEDVAALPGVRAVSLVDAVPGGFMTRARRSTEIEGYTPASGESREIDAGIVGPHYFTNMGVPVLSGRDFDDRDRDGAPCVAIINEAFAQRYLRGVTSALGKHLARHREPVGKEMCEIVGIIRDNAWQSLHEIRPYFALPVLQEDRRRMTLLVSSVADPASLVSPVRQSIRALDANIPLADVQTLREYFDVTLYPFRLVGYVLAGCGIMALFLATIGIYGTIAFSVAQRSREVSIRMALGAVRTDVLRMVVGQGMLLVSYGLALGLLLGVTLARVLTLLPIDATQVFGVSATDVITFGGVTIVLGLVALLACYVPALRATRVDPAATLRSP